MDISPDLLTAETVIAQQRALLSLARSANPDPTIAIRRILEIDARTMGVERVSYWEYTPDRRAIVCRQLFRLSTAEHSSGAILNADAYPRYFRALEEHLVVPADDAAHDPRTNEYRDDYLAPNGIGAMMDVPVWLHGRVHGIVCHEHVGGSRHWYFGEQLFAASIANHVSLALEGREVDLATSEASKLRSSILSNLSHEVRTPLNLILGNLQLLQAELDAETAARVAPMLEGAERGSQRLVRTIHALLDLARAEAGAMPFVAEPIALSDLVHHELADLGLRARGRGIDFAIEIAAPDLVLLFDRYALTSAVRCLVDNAVKFTSEGTIAVRVARSGDRVTIEIRDTGIGIDESFRPRLFRAFEQADGGLARRFEGVGIGLALARALVERGGGRIAIESELGRGTTVRVDFPPGATIA